MQQAKGTKESLNMKLIAGGNQLSLIRDTEEVLKFLEFVGKKSILDEHAVNCKLTACNSLFSVLNEDEDSIEYILSNLDLLLNRYLNKNKSVTHNTLKVYKSRVKSCLEDYKAWSADPFVWERNLTEKKLAERKESQKAKKVTKPKEKKAESVDEEIKVEAQEVQNTSSSSGTMLKVAFPLRKDLSVEVTIPKEGLTLKELKRLGMFLFPYCKDVEFTDSPWMQ